VQHGARSGDGIFVDCIVPIMRGTATAPGQQTFATDQFGVKQTHGGPFANARC
jgi:hypothetical protein